MISLEKFHVKLSATKFKYMKGNIKKEFTVSLKFNFDIHITHSIIITYVMWNYKKKDKNF